MSATATNAKKRRNISQSEYYQLLFEWISEVRKINISLRYYLKIEPYDLDLWVWANRVEELKWLRKNQSKEPDE